MALRQIISKAAASTSKNTLPKYFSTSLDRAFTKEKYEEVLNGFATHRACAVLRTNTSEACPKAMQAAIDGGFKICEFTLTTPDCLQHLSDFRAKYDGQKMIGCGTILTTEDAENGMFVNNVIPWC